MINSIVFIFIAIGILFSVVRLMIGPTISDRVVSVDTINIIVTGAVAFMAHIFNNAVYLDIAIVYGILAFLETIIISRYLEAKV